MLHTTGNGMLDGAWNFSWDDCGVSNEEDSEVGEVTSFLCLVNNIQSEVV